MLSFCLQYFAFIFLPFLASPAFSAVHQVEAIGLTVNDLDREVRFFTQVLPFEEVSCSEFKDPASAQLLGLSHAELKVAVLKLGDERITLTEHVAEKGRPIPPDSRSYDLWFQHIAIVVRDMDQAYEQLRQHKVKHVSTGPQTLPAWNKAAAGIKAFYFRDPEDHVLEIIYFPPGKGDPKWQSSRPALRDDEADAPLFLGIDHTAIVVSDTDKSLAFYRDLLGMRVAGESENYGAEQEHLNQVFGARLRITALRAAKGPGIEFLEYITPPGGRALPDGAKANDLIFWRTQLLADDLNDFAVSLRKLQTKFISAKVVALPNDFPLPNRDGGNQGEGSTAAATTVPAVIVRDPDGHALELIESSAATTASAQR